MLYVGTRYELTCFVTLANAVNTGVEVRIHTIHRDRISVGNITRVNVTTFAGSITYNVLYRMDRMVTVITSLLSVPRSPFIIQSDIHHDFLRLDVRCKYIDGGQMCKKKKKTTHPSHLYHINFNTVLEYTGTCICVKHTVVGGEATCISQRCSRAKKKKKKLLLLVEQLSQLILS